MFCLIQVLHENKYFVGFYSGVNALQKIYKKKKEQN